jgi:DNA-binding PadR family transcriptional regulator
VVKNPGFPRGFAGCGPGAVDRKLSAGTLYPILHGLEEKGYLTSTEERTGSAARRIHRGTPAGVRALAAAKLKVRELFGELFEDEGCRREPSGTDERLFYSAPVSRQRLRQARGAGLQSCDGSARSGPARDLDGWRQP